MVFYRKYRPQKIEDLDSKKVRETLLSTLSQNPSHAFLFTGPKGLGKTSAARIVAKVVNCTGRESATEKKRLNVKNQLSDVDSIEPCNKCDSCVSITNGTNMDILEIDAASNRGIDEIRDLKEKIRLSPLSAKIKVYIIDEVHMLTTEAFNALLKTLEEPPEHAMFILCTTDPQKLPATIISRCFQINFNLATEDEIVHSLKRIVLSEKIKIDDESLYAIAKMAEGGFRDAAKILEEISLIAPEKITKEVLEDSYQTTSVPLYISNLLTSFNNENKKEAVKDGFQIVEKLISQGVDIKSFISQILTELNKRLLEEVGVGSKSEKVSTVNREFDIQDLKLLVKLFNNVYQDTKYAVLPQLPLELAIIEWAMKDQQKINEVYDDEEAKDVISSSFSDDSNVSVSKLRKQVGNIKKAKAMYGATPKQDSPKSSHDAANEKPITLMHASAGENSKEWLSEFWKNIISEMKSYNHTIAGVLRGCSIGSYDKKTLVIETSYNFHKERLDDIKTKTELARIAKLLTGKDVSVVVELKK